MAQDRRLSRNFELAEFPCYQQATEAQVAALQETVARVLQPARDRWGPIVPTSWMWWSDGCRPRSGPHGVSGGTVDFVALESDTRDVWEWGKQYLLPSGYIGRWIYEPARGPDADQPQGEHIHVAPVDDMVAVAGDRRIQALEETTEGNYRLALELPPWGTEGDPVELPGFTVTAGGGWLPWVLLAAVAGTLALDPAPPTLSR